MFAFDQLLRAVGFGFLSAHDHWQIIVHTQIGCKRNGRIRNAAEQIEAIVQLRVHAYERILAETLDDGRKGDQHSQIDVDGRLKAGLQGEIAKLDGFLLEKF